MLPTQSEVFLSRLLPSVYQCFAHKTACTKPQGHGTVAHVRNHKKPAKLAKRMQTHIGEGGNVHHYQESYPPSEESFYHKSIRGPPEGFNQTSESLRMWMCSIYNLRCQFSPVTGGGCL